MAIDFKDLVFSEEPQPESIPQSIGRNVVSGLEKVAEIPLNINQLLGSIGKNIAQPIEKQVGAIPLPMLGEKLPTSEQFRTKSEESLGYEPGSFTPKNIVENIAQEAIPSAAIALGTGGFGTLGQSAKSILGSSVAGNVLEEIGNHLGFDDSTKAALHFGGSLWGSTLGTKSKVVKEYNKNYDLSEKALPKDAIYKSSKFNDIATSMKDKATKFPGNEKIEPVIEKFNNLIQGDNRINIKDAVEFKKALNKIRFSYPKQLVDEFIDPMVNVLKDEVIIPYGKSENHKFLTPWLKAENDFKATKTGAIKLRKLNETGQKLLEKVNASPDIAGKWAPLALKLALGGGGSYFVSPLTGAALFGGAQGLSSLNKFAGLLKNSNTAQKAFADVTKNLMLGHTNNAINYLKKLDREISKQDISFDDLVFG